MKISAHLIVDTGWPIGRDYANKMTQNIYDHPAFFEAYSKLGRSVDGLAGAAEWSALMALLPDMRELNVVDLGCGYGWFCRWARAQGAETVLGLDLSQKMLSERSRHLLTLRSLTQKPIWKILICQRPASTWPIVRSHFTIL